MYDQIARNKRRSAAYVAIFFGIWLGAGVGAGAVAAAYSGDQAAIVTGGLIAVLLALAAIVFVLLTGTGMIMGVAGARLAQPQQYPQLHGLVQAQAIGSGLPMPAVYVIDDPSPNAFATGTSPEHAAIAVTTGLLGLMNREELEGVLAHEMSHIKNYDTRLLLIVGTLIGLAGLLAGMLWRAPFLVRTGRRNGNQAAVVILAAAALLSIIAFILGPLVRLALSRRRELLADASGVELTRNPAGLLNALRKLQDNQAPLARINNTTAAMCIDDPRQRHQNRMKRFLDTHPPITERIAVLESMLHTSTI